MLDAPMTNGGNPAVTPQDTLADTAEWFRRAVPVPTGKNFQTQLGVHFEEVAEMVETLQGSSLVPQSLLGDAERSLKRLAEHLKRCPDMTIEVTSQRLLLDSLCDQIVTATGVGVLAGCRMVEAMAEVNRSNWSKFVDGQPIFDANYKIQKGPDYFRPNLGSCLPPDGTD